MKATNHRNFTKTQLVAEIQRLNALIESEVADLQATNIALQDLFDNSNDLIFVCDTKGRILFANSIFLKKMGYTWEELTLLVLPSLISGSHKIQLLRQLVLLLSKQEVSKFNLVLHHKKGKKVYLRGKISIRYEAGQIVALRGIMYDTTDRVRIEAELLSQTARLNAIFEGGSHIMWSVNRRREFTSFNQNYVKALSIQYGLVPAIGQHSENLRKALRKDNLADFWKEKMKKAFEGEIQHFEIQARNIHGDTVWQDVYLNPIRSHEGNIDEVSAIAHDVTDKKQANQEALKAKELAEQSLKAKEIFLANMSHEIRTPMNGIIGMMDLLAETSLNHKQKDFVRTVRKSSETLMTILNDILDLSKIEAGKMQLHLKPTDLRQTVEKVYHLFLPQATQKSNAFMLHIAPDIPEYIVADETRLLQILSNLTSNAIKFTENGKIEIAVGIESLQRQQQDPEEETYMLKISVKDTGIGISFADRDRLFESFEQIDNRLSKLQNGTGLGLSISKQLVEMMNGEIGIESHEKQQGSIFFFTFQTKIAHTPIISTPQSEITISEKIQKKLRILVVDDNAINRKVVSEILKKAKINADLAESGKIALLKLHKNNYDIVFMDIQMPEMDGIETLEHLKRMSLSPAPSVIALTAYAMREDKENLISVGFDGYLSKPIRSDELLQAIIDTIQTDKNPSIPPNFIDFTIWHSLITIGGKDFLKEILEQLCHETKGILAEMKIFYEQEDFANLQKHVHTLKGSCGTLGLAYFAQQNTILENLLRERNFTELPNAWHTYLGAWECFESNQEYLFQSFEASMV